MKIAFSKQILEKHSNTKFYETLFSEGRVFQRGWTVRQA